MAKLEKILIDKYRSIDHVELYFQENAPLVLIGENNAGKSNIIKAIDLVLGEFWPGNHEPEDHEFYFRNTSQPIGIEASFSDPLGRYYKVVWKYDPANTSSHILFRGVDEYDQYKYISNEDRSELVCITISADRRLAYQLSYASKYTMLSKLMHRFHRAMETKTDIKTGLETRFRETKELFQQIPEFKAFRDSLREGLSDLVSTMTHKLDVDFEAYNPTNFFHALRLQADEEGEPRTLEELGTGEEQILALSFAHAYAKAFHGGVLLAIEEPEVHLHPLAQKWLARKIRTMASDGLQIIIETHNPSFIDILGLDGLVLVKKEEELGTRAIQLTTREFTEYCTKRGAPANSVLPENILDFYQTNASKEILEGFFAKKIVIVEGPTESLALPIYFRRLGLDVEREGIAVIPVNGKGNLAKWWRMFTAYGIPTYVIFDNDPEHDNSGVKRRDTLRAIRETDIEEVLSKEELFVKDLYAVFGTDFETCLRSMFSCYNYESLEDEAGDFVPSGAKPFTARYVAKKICATCDSEEQPWDEFRELVKMISCCTASSLSEQQKQDEGLPF